MNNLYLIKRPQRTAECCPRSLFVALVLSKRESFSKQDWMSSHSVLMAGTQLDGAAPWDMDIHEQCVLYHSHAIA